jgi:hypothetical protein
VKGRKANWIGHILCRNCHILHRVKGRKANWIGHILCRNCPLRHVNEGKVEGRTEVTGRRGRRRKQILADLNETRGHCKLKEQAIDGTLWGKCFGKGY